ncbi:Protein of uncharacterised function (DUF3170) [Streptococcus pneumoniae]|nr:Protein of uncharacterised function (DUF3170) [Streptococcus pneumoniae]CJG66220.1 Protein of uncharacterised function (DUF3170) [Streptococcus pneumoniae]
MHICYWMLSRQVSSCYIDKVNSLIWQATLRNVLNRIIHRCFQDFVWQDDIVVLLIEVTNSLKNFKSILCRRSIDLHFVETTSKSSILQDGVTVFVLSCCPNHCQFSTRESWLENIRKPFRTTVSTSATSTKNLVNFIKEEDNIPCFFHFID